MGKHRVAGAASGLIAVMTLVACGSSSSRPAATTHAPSTTLDPAAADAGAKASWEAFFNGKSPIDTRLPHLESGATLKPVLEAEQATGSGTTAKAKKVSVLYDADCTGNGQVSPCAVVTYDILAGGVVALGDSTGYAVYTDGTWKVSKTAFCALASLVIKPPPPQCA